MSDNIPVAKSPFYSSFEDENNQIVNEALEFAHSANENYTGTRLATDGVVLEVARRTLDFLDSQPFSVRRHQTLTEVSHFLSLLQKNKVITASAKHTDLLPIAHPQSTALHNLSSRDLLIAKARWVADDPSIRDEETRALVASMLSAPEDSPEREYYATRLESMPQGTVPVKALLAAFNAGLGANKGYWMRQRRDSEGRFAFEGGGLSALVRGLDNIVRRLTGRMVGPGVGEGPENDYFDMEPTPGSLVRVPASSTKSSKAYLPSPDAKDGMSPVRAKVQAGDSVIDINDLVRPEAPSGFTKDESWKPDPREVEFYGEDADFGQVFSDGNYRIRKFDMGSSPIARDNFELAQDAEKSCFALAASGLTAAAGDACPISTKGAGKDGALDPKKPVFFVGRENDPRNPDVFAATQSWADTMKEVRQDEDRYAKQQSPAPGDAKTRTAPEAEQQGVEDLPPVDQEGQRISYNQEQLNELPEGSVVQDPRSGATYVKTPGGLWRRSDKPMLTSRPQRLEQGFKVSDKVAEEARKEAQKTDENFVRQEQPFDTRTPEEKKYDDAPVGSRVFVPGQQGFGGPGTPAEMWEKQADGTWKELLGSWPTPRTSAEMVKTGEILTPEEAQRAMEENQKGPAAPTNIPSTPGARPGEKFPLWVPGIPMGEAAARVVRPRPRPGRPRGRTPRGPWGTTGPGMGHAPYPIPGRRVFPGEIADMRIGSEIEQVVGGLLSRLFGFGKKRQLRKVGNDQWVDLETGETFTNEQVANMAATSGRENSPFVGLATGPEVRPGRFINQMSGSLFSQMPIGTELSDKTRIVQPPWAQFRKIGYNQWRRWDGKILTDAEMQKKSFFMSIDRVGEFGPGTPPGQKKDGEPSGEDQKPKLPRGPLTPEELAALAVGAVVSIPQEGSETPRYFQKTGDDQWRELDPNNAIPNPGATFTNEDLVNMGGDITLESEPEPKKLPTPGISPSQLSPEALAELPVGTIVGFPDEFIEAYAPPRREGQSEEEYRLALEEAKDFFRRNQWRKQAPNVWTNQDGVVRTDADIADLEKTPGFIMSMGDQWSIPEGYYEINRETPYLPQGASEGQTSLDFTDDPIELAQRFDEKQLKRALKEALEAVENENGYGYLPFENGEEPVPAEALYAALVRKIGIADADKFVSDVYGEGRPFDAERDVALLFPDINSDDPDKRKAALIDAWNSQWGRGQYALDEQSNVIITGDDNDSLAAAYILDRINKEEWGEEFLRNFKQEYDEALNARTKAFVKAQIEALQQRYPGLLSGDPEERRDAIFRALDDLIQDDEIVFDEDGNIIEVNPKQFLTKYLWDQAQQFIGGSIAPVARKGEGTLPPSIDGATDAEKAKVEQTGDYSDFLMKNQENFANVWNNLYNPLPERFVPGEGQENLDPLKLARRFTEEELKDQLRKAILDGSGYGTLSFESPSGEPVEVRVPAEALRDALQLHGVNTNEFIQQIFNDNPSPARRTQQLLDEIADLTQQRDEATNPTEKGRLTREINKKISQVGPRYKAIQALRKREGELDRLSKRSNLTDEQRNQVNERLERVRSALEEQENIFNSDLEGGQNLTPFEDNFDSELQKFDFEKRPSTQRTTTAQEEEGGQGPQAREIRYKRVGNKTFIRQGEGNVISNDPEVKEFLAQNGFVYDRNVNIQFEIAEMTDEEFYNFMRELRDRFGISLTPAPGQDAIDFDNPTGGTKPPHNPSNTAKKTKEELLKAIRDLEPVDSEGNKDTSKRAVGIYLAKIIALLDSYLADLDPKSPLYKFLEAWRRKYDNRAGRHGKEKDLGTNAADRDNRIVYVRPGDYRPGDVFVSDHFTITKVEKSDVPYEEGDPYYGEQRIVYTGYYPGGREETRSEVGRSEYYRTEAVYRGVTPPSPGENDPIPPPPNAVEYLPEGTPETEVGADGTPRSNIREVTDKELDAIVGGKTYYMPDPEAFPEEHARYMEDFEAWKQKVIARKNLWSPGSPVPPTTPATPQVATDLNKPTREVKNAPARDLLPGDITLRQNQDGTYEIFVIEEIVPAEAPAEAPQPSGKEREFYDEIVSLEPDLGSETSSDQAKKSAYIRLEDKYRKEARDAGQLTGSNRDPKGEGELFDKWKWLTSQRTTVLENKPLQPPSEAAPAPAPAPAGPAKVVVRGYHPGHQSQERSWNPDTPIDYIRGETNLPPAGDKPPVMSSSEISRSSASAEEKAQMRKEREATLAESSKDYMASVMIESPPETTSRVVQEPNSFRIIQTKLAAFWRKGADLARGKTGKEIKEALKSERVVFFDFETSGRGFDRDVPSAPVQVAAVVYENGKEVDRKIFYINPGEKLGAFYYEKQPIRKDNNAETDNFPEGGKLAHLINDQVIIYTKTDGKYVNDADPTDVLDNLAALKGRDSDILQVNEQGNIFLQASGLKDSDGNPLSDEFLSSVQTGVEDAIRELIDFIGPNAYLVAYNADFDVNYLQVFADRFGISFNYEGVIDPLPMARELNPSGAGSSRGNKLEEVAARYGIIREPGEWHNAEVDVEVLPEILDRLLEDIPDNSPLLDVDRRIAEYNQAVRSYNEQLAAWRAQNNIPTPTWNAPPGGKTSGSDPDTVVENLNDLELEEIGENANSILGGKINDNWVKDDENTSVLSSGPTNVENLVTGDLFADKQGLYNEVVLVQDDRLTKQKVVIFRNLSTGKIYRAYSSPGARLQLGTNDLPVRRRKEFEGMTQPEILDLISRNKRKNIQEMAVPRTRLRDEQDAVVSQAIDDFINNKSAAPSIVDVTEEEMEEALTRKPGGRETTEFHFDRNGRAVAVGDKVLVYITRINEETRKKEIIEIKSGEVIELVPEHKAGDKTYRNYVRFMEDGNTRAGARRYPADKLELVNAPLKDEILDALEDIALTPEDEPGIDRMAIARRIERLLPFISNEPGYMPSIGNNVKAAIRAYQRGDYFTASKAIAEAEEYVDYLESPRLSLQEIANLAQDRLRGLIAVGKDPNADDKVKRLLSEAVLLINREARALARRTPEGAAGPRRVLKDNVSQLNYAKALRKLDELEDYLWSEGEERRSRTKSSPLDIKRFADGKEITSAMDAPLSLAYFKELLKNAAAPDYELEGKEEIVRQAKRAYLQGEIFPAAQVLEKLGRERERQLDLKYPEAKIVGIDGNLVKRKDAGKVSYEERVLSKLNHKDPAKFTKKTLKKAEDKQSKADTKEIQKVDKSERRGLFYTSAGSLQEGDIVSTDTMRTATVTKIRKNTDGSLSITVTQSATRPVLDEDGNAEISYELARFDVLNVDPNAEILLLTRSGGDKVPLPPKVREFGAARPREGSDYNEFEGFVSEDEDSEGPVEPTPRDEKFYLAVPKSSRKDDITPTPEQAAIMDALDDPAIKKLKVMALAGTGKTTTLKMAAQKILKQDPNAQITVIMFSVELSEDTARKMPKKGVQVIRSGQLANEALPQVLKDKRKDKNKNKRLTAREIARELGIQGPRKLKIGGEEKEFSPAELVSVIFKAERAYANSADDVIEAKHFGEEFEEVPDEIVDLAQQFFELALDPDSRVPLQHHHVVKLWSLSSPDLSTRSSAKNQYLFYDEAQDVNPVVEKVIGEQTNFNKIVVVGDSSQAIFQFTGAVDSLDRFEADAVFPLTRSYRFGPQIAGFANRFLAFLGVDYRLEGAGPQGEIVEDLQDPDVVLSRTNGGGLALLASFIEQGKQVAIDASVWSEYDQLIGGILGLRARVNDPARTLYNLHPDLEGYEDIQEVLKAKKDGLLGGNVSAVLNVLQRLGSDDSAALEGESDTDVLRNLLNKFQLVRDVNNTKLAQNYTPIPYNEVKRGSIHILNNEIPESARTPAYAWTDDAGNMYFTVIDRSFSAKGKEEAETLKAYFKSRGFKRVEAKDVKIPDALGKVWEKNSVWVVPRSADNPLNLPPDPGAEDEQDTIPFYRLFNEARQFANGYFATEQVPISFTTAHKAKGREWDRVRLATDFGEPKVNRETLELEYPDVPELNLAYTAATRARRVLDPGNLNWIFDETSDSDEASTLPTPIEEKFNLAVPRKKVTKEAFAAEVNNSDKALTEQTTRVLEALNKALADGEIPPWVAPWEGQNPASQLPLSVTTGKPYSGTNLIYLQAVAKNNGWKDPRWITQEEINLRGGKVREGQLPTRMTAWLPNYTTVVDENGNELQTIYSMSPVDHFVYNAEQVTGLNLGNIPVSPQNTALEAENIIFSSYSNAPAVDNRERTAKEVEQDDSPAYYNKTNDTIVIPPRETFSSPEKYLEALIHELIHSTGSSNRLNRNSMVLPGDRDSYSLKQIEDLLVEEEFVAQIGTAILASRLGVNLDIPNVAAYMNQWKEVFGNDPDKLARVAKSAQDAADYILRGRNGGGDGGTPNAPETPGLPPIDLKRDGKNILVDANSFNDLPKPQGRQNPIVLSPADGEKQTYNKIVQAMRQDIPIVFSYNGRTVSGSARRIWQMGYFGSPNVDVEDPKVNRENQTFSYSLKNIRDIDPAEIEDVLGEEGWRPVRFNLAVPRESTNRSKFKKNLASDRDRAAEVTKQVTDMVVKAIEEGKELPWNKPWTSKNIFSMPYSVTSSRPYRGFNIITLWAAGLANGWEDNRWITFPEAQKRGGSVKKGSKATYITHWSPVIKEVEQPDGTKKDEVVAMKSKVFPVFNVEQTEGVQGLPEPELMEAVPVLEAETFVLERFTDAPAISNKLQDKAYWRPSTDEIVMPLREQFSDVTEYLATLFHELVHSTGHESRLNRKDLGDKYSTHLDARGEEELIADMGAALLASLLGVEINLERTAAYAQSWLQPLKNNPEMISKAAQQAQAAVDYILGENKPNLGGAGATGEERAAEILSQRLNVDFEQPYIGNYGVAAADLIRRENEEEDA